MAGKTTVSTPLDDVTLNLLDRFCIEVRRSRAEVLRGLLYALLVDGKHTIFNEWRKKIAPSDKSGREELVLDALMEHSPRSVRIPVIVGALQGRVSRSTVHRSLNTLMAAGKVEKVTHLAGNRLPRPRYRVCLTECV